MQRKLYELKENPLSVAIYGEGEDVSDLVESIKKDGILTALIVKPDGTIISGHRRYRAARKAGLITVPVEERTPKDKLEEERWILTANKQREKTATQRYREGERWSAIFAEMGKANISNGVSQANKKRGQNSAFLETKKAEMITKTPSSETEVTGGQSPSLSNLNKLGIVEQSSEPQPNTPTPDIETVEREEKPEPAPQEKKVEPVRTRELVAEKLGMSPSSYNRLKTIGDAAKAGVPEAKEALDRLDKGEISTSRAYEITKKATTPEKPATFAWGGGKVDPGKVQECMTAALKVNPWVLNIERDIRQAEPTISTTEAKQLAAFLGTHIALLAGFKETLLEFINKRGGYQPQDETEECY